MGGATNVRKFLERVGPVKGELMLAGLWAEREQRQFRSVREHVFVCVAYLEDGLIRAVSTATVADVISAQEERGSLRIMQKHPDQRGRPLVQQLRRFMGT